MIVRELLVKLGFNIDTEKFKQFENLSDAMKNDMGSVRKSLLGKLGINVDTAKFKEFFKMTNDAKARMEHLRKSVNSPLSPDIDKATRKISAYNAELKDLSETERRRVLELNRIEKQATREVNQQRRTQRTELKSLEEIAEEKAKRNRQRLNSLVSASQRAARAVALISAGVTAGIGLSIRGTLKDVENFKTQKKPGEKTNSFFDKQQVSTVDTFNKALGDTKDAVARIRNSFVIKLLPAITKILERIKKWIDNNKELIKQKIESLVAKISKAVTDFSDAIAKAVPKVILLIEKIAEWKGVIKLLMGIGIIGWLSRFTVSVFTAARAFGVLTAASLRFMFTPMGALITAITAAFGLLANEIYVTWKGGDSFLKDIGDSKAWKKITDSVCSFIDFLKEAWQWIMKVKEGIESFSTKIKDGVVKVYHQIIDEDDALSGAFNSRFGMMMTPNDISNMPEYIARTPNQSSNYNQTTKHNHNNLEQKINFNMSFNVPQGTNAKELKTIEKIVKDELQKHTRFINEQTLAGLVAS